MSSWQTVNPSHRAAGQGTAIDETSGTPGGNVCTGAVGVGDETGAWLHAVAMQRMERRRGGVVLLMEKL